MTPLWSIGYPISLFSVSLFSLTVLQLHYYTHTLNAGQMISLQQLNSTKKNTNIHDEPDFKLGVVSDEYFSSGLLLMEEVRSFAIEMVLNYDKKSLSFCVSVCCSFDMRHLRYSWRKGGGMSCRWHNQNFPLVSIHWCGDIRELESSQIAQWHQISTSHALGLHTFWEDHQPYIGAFRSFINRKSFSLRGKCTWRISSCSTLVRC